MPAAAAAAAAGDVAGGSIASGRRAGSARTEAFGDTATVRGGECDDGGRAAARPGPGQTFSQTGESSSRSEMACLEDGSGEARWEPRIDGYGSDGMA